MKIYSILIINTLSMGGLIFVLLFLNTYINDIFIPAQIKNGWYYFVRFLIVNIESLSILIILSKIFSRYIICSKMVNKITILDILTVLILSTIFFYHLWTQDL